jgi:hypothetical protein
MRPGIYLDIPEEQYHADPCPAPSLSCSVAQSLVLESPAHAYLKHPKLGGEKFIPTAEMDRGTLLHALLLGAGLSRIEVVECNDWKKKDNQEIRDALRDAGQVPVTRRLYDDAVLAAGRLKERLRAKGYEFKGHSEVTLIWNETAERDEVICRGRMDHLIEGNAFDLKITDDANPRVIDNRMTAMGYDIQGIAYTRGLAYALPDLRGRTSFTFLFCEPNPPYAVTPVQCMGSLRELGERKWRAAVSIWNRCLRDERWPDYTDGIHYAEAKPWQLAEYGIDAA